jgi:hypothetical protein
MTKYIVQDNINFYEELYKSLDDDIDNTIQEKEKTCLISLLPLQEPFVKLECGHTFNYEPLYVEILKQRYIFKTYDKSNLTKHDLKKIKNDLFIKCPYCRNVQSELLPYEDTIPNIVKLYGVNTNDKACYPYHTICNYSNGYVKGHCHWVIQEYDAEGNSYTKECKYTQVTLHNGDNKTYCYNHLSWAHRQYLKQQKQIERQKIKDMKEKSKEDSKKAKEDAKKLKEDAKKEKADAKKEPVIIGGLCTQILKSGKKKGEQCCCKIFDYEQQLCKRHTPNIVNIEETI